MKLLTTREVEANQEQFLRALLEAAKLRYEKFKVYGKVYDVFGVKGITMRIHEKNARNFTHVEREFPDYTKIRSDLLDIANYAIMGVMVIDDLWGDSELDTIRAQHGITKPREFDSILLDVVHDAVNVDEDDMHD